MLTSWSDSDYFIPGDAIIPGLHGRQSTIRIRIDTSAGYHDFFALTLTSVAVGSFCLNMASVPLTAASALSKVPE